MLPLILIQLVTAHPPDTSLGTQPYVSFAGHLPTQSSVALVTVAAGQDLIINTGLCNGSCAFLIDGAVAVPEPVRGLDHNYTDILFVSGNGQLVVPSGSTLSISSSSGTPKYLVTGRYVQQGHPRRSFSGQAQANNTTLLTTSNTEVFIITALITENPNVSVYQDSTTIYEAQSYGSYYGMCNAPCKGNVTIPVAAGTSLNIRTDGGSTWYYLEGFYLQP